MVVVAALGQRISSDDGIGSRVDRRDLTECLHGHQHPVAGLRELGYREYSVHGGHIRNICDHFLAALLDHRDHARAEMSQEKKAALRIDARVVEPIGSAWKDDIWPYCAQRQIGAARCQRGRHGGQCCGDACDSSQ